MNSGQVSVFIHLYNSSVLQIVQQNVQQFLFNAREQSMLVICRNLSCDRLPPRVC